MKRFKALFAKIGHVILHAPAWRPTLHNPFADRDSLLLRRQELEREREEWSAQALIRTDLLDYYMKLVEAKLISAGDAQKALSRDPIQPSNDSRPFAPAKPRRRNPGVRSTR